MPSNLAQFPPLALILPLWICAYIFSAYRQSTVLARMEPARSDELERSLPTQWSFVPAGVIAVVSLFAALLWPEDVDAYGYREMSYPGALLIGLNFLATIGCAWGSIVYLFKRRGTLSGWGLFAPLFFLAASGIWISFWIAVYRIL
jgi:hypothetical protein